MSFEKLNLPSFNSDPAMEFERVAGGRPQWTKDYDGINSKMKKKLMWNFFDSAYATPAMKNSKSVYSGHEEGVTIAEMLQEMNDGDDQTNHSIEHVIPKKNYLKVPLTGVYQKNIVKGATVNPLNFLPSHASVNSSRNERVLDFDGDSVTSVTLARVDDEYRRFQGGKDSTGEWVPPIVSRGDIARCVVYMQLMYRLEYVDEKELLVLQKWMKEDKPSAFEIAYGLWLRDTQPLKYEHNLQLLQNPFVSNPELAENDVYFDKLVMAMLEKDLSNHRHAPSRPVSMVSIDAVLPNARGVDTSGTELVTLRNNSSQTLTLNGWALEIVVHHRSSTRSTSYDCTGIVLHPHELTDLFFPDDDVLPNSRKTTLNLKRESTVVTSFTYSSNAPRAGKWLSKL